MTIAYLTVNWSYYPYAAITLKSYNEDGNLLSLENNYMSLFSAMLFEGEYIRRQIVIQNPNKLEMEEISYIFPSLYENEGMEDKENINQYNVSKSKFVLKPEGWILDK